MKDRQELLELGFAGFKTVLELMNSCKDIPKEMGVYVVLREKNEKPVILDERPFDCQEDKYPSYAKSELEAKWLDGTHGGGRSIWQLADAKELIVCWRVLSEEEPRFIEERMISEFREAHNGMRPFANRKD